MNLRRIADRSVGPEPLDLGGPAAVVDALHDAVQVHVNALGVSDDVVAREELLLVEGMDRKEVSGGNPVFNCSVLSMKQQIGIFKHLLSRIFSFSSTFESQRHKSCCNHCTYWAQVLQFVGGLKLWLCCQ